MLLDTCCVTGGEVDLDVEAFDSAHEVFFIARRLLGVALDLTGLKLPVLGEHEEFVGVFTTETRQTWANIRSSLETLSPVNKEIFSVIDSALFVVCLDDEEPMTTDERVANMLHGSYRLDAKNEIQVGSCCNRWYDKMQLIVCKNGAALAF